MRVVVFDTETTSLEPAEGHLIEVGAALVDLKERGVVAQFSCLLPIPDGVVVDPSVHGITQGLLDGIGSVQFPPMLAFDAFLKAPGVVAAVAHNSSFDVKWMQHVGAYPFLRNDGTKLPVVCSRLDVEWPARVGSSGKLAHICTDLHVPVIDHHRALSDVIMLTKAILAVEDPVRFIIDALSPKALVVAIISFSEKQLAKDKGFQWNATDRRWEKRMSVDKARSTEWGFQVRIIEE